MDRLLQGGLSPEKPTIVVSNGTLPTQRKIMCSLGELVARTREEGLAAPAVIFIGNAIGLATKANWFEDRPLFGRRFVVTRSTAQNGEMKNKPQNLGADVLELPLIRILPTEDKKLVAEVFAGIATYDWSVFTSANGAREFMRLFFLAFGDIRSFGPMRAQLIHGSNYFEKANENILSFAMIETQQAVDNLDEILSVPNLTGVYIGPADMSSSYGMKPQFDVKEDPVFSNIKLIAKKANEYGKIAGIHNGTTQYAKEMIGLGFKLVTISSDFRSMSAHAQSVIDDMKDKTKETSKNEAY